MANTANNVTQAKPKVTGAVWTAPTSTTLPISATDELDDAFVCMGYISEDGVTNSNSTDSSKTKAWGGDIVLNSITSKTDDWKMKFIEALNVNVLKTVYGDENVTGTLETGIAVKSTAEQPDPQAYVIDKILKGGILHRTVIPNGTLTSLGDTVYKDGNPIGYDVTITASADASGGTHYNYIQNAPAQSENAKSQQSDGEDS